MTKQTEKLIKLRKSDQLKSKAISLMDLEFFSKRLESLKEGEIRKELGEQNDSKTTVIEDNRDQQKIKTLTEELKALPAKDNEKEIKAERDFAEETARQVADKKLVDLKKLDILKEKLNEINKNEKRKIELVQEIQEEENKRKTEDKSDPLRIDAIEKDLARIATCKKNIDTYKITIADIDFYLTMINELDEDIIKQLDEFPEIIYDDDINTTSVE